MCENIKVYSSLNITTREGNDRKWLAIDRNSILFSKKQGSRKC